MELPIHLDVCTSIGKSRLCEEPNKHPDYNISSCDEAIFIVNVKEEIASSLQSYFKKETF